MNILQIESSLQWGGCEKRCAQEVLWLRKKGHAAWIACDPRGKFFSMCGPELAHYLIPVRFSFAVNPITFFKLFSIILANKIEVIHTHEALDSTLALPFHLLGIPLVRSRHWTLGKNPDFGKRLFFQHSCRKLIAASKEIYDTFLDKYKVPHKKLCLIGEGAEPPPPKNEYNLSREKFRSSWGIPKDAIVFGIIGIIRGEKGHREFIESAIRILEKNKKVWFVIIGEAPGDRSLELYFIDLLREKSRESGFSYIQQIIMTGFYKSIQEAYCGVDIVVIPSYSEAQSKVGPEALKYGKAVIASRVGGLPEVIRHNETGLLVTPGDIEGLLRAMESLIYDPILRERLSNAGQEYAQKYLRFDQRMEELLACYESCIKK